MGACVMVAPGLATLLTRNGLSSSTLFVFMFVVT
jgi:hypothetical protein